jgi:mannose-6-phosphate isomerase-like protein (cupin superfamily)
MTATAAPSSLVAAPRALVLGPTEGRTPAPLNIVGEETLVKLGPTDSDGQLAVFHLLAPPMSGPPLHVHSREDEWFYVLDGELVFEIDGARTTVGPGGSVWLRRGVVHRYQNFGGRDARLLIVTTPGGFHDAFVELSAATPPGGLPSPEAAAAVDAKYGTTTLGPPMTA